MGKCGALVTFLTVSGIFAITCQLSVFLTKGLKKWNLGNYPHLEPGEPVPQPGYIKFVGCIACITCTSALFIVIWGSTMTYGFLRLAHITMY